MYDAKSANSPFNDSSSPFAGCPVPEAMEVRSPISRGPMYVHTTTNTNRPPYEGLGGAQ